MIDMKGISWSIFERALSRFHRIDYTFFWRGTIMEASGMKVSARANGELFLSF